VTSLCAFYAGCAPSRAFREGASGQLSSLGGVVKVRVLCKGAGDGRTRIARSKQLNHHPLSHQRRRPLQTRQRNIALRIENAIDLGAARLQQDRHRALEIFFFFIAGCAPSRAFREGASGQLSSLGQGSRSWQGGGRWTIPYRQIKPAQSSPAAQPKPLPAANSTV